MVDLTKFSKEDLKKTAAEINDYLKKVDETSYDPRQSEEKTTHNEEDLGGASKKITPKEGETTEKSVETKKDFPQVRKEPDPAKPMLDEEMTGPTQGDTMAQILAMLKEILGKLNAPAPEVPAPTDQIQHAATPPTPTPTPATTPTTPAKSDININVTKTAVEEVLKGMGITPSELAKKPIQDAGHPIEKGADLTYSKIAKMSWDEVHEVNAAMNPGPYY